MNESIIAHNLLLGKICDNCMFQFESINVTTLIDVDQVFIHPKCKHSIGINTCSEWADMYSIIVKDMTFAQLIGACNSEKTKE